MGSFGIGLTLLVGRLTDLIVTNSSQSPCNLYRIIIDGCFYGKNECITG